MPGRDLRIWPILYKKTIHLKRRLFKKKLLWPLAARKDEKIKNESLGIVASISSATIANHLAHKTSSFGTESPEAHKYAAKNALELFRRAKIGFAHHDKKRGKFDYARIITPFYFMNDVYVATTTLRIDNGKNKIYTIEAIETTTGDLPRTSWLSATSQHSTHEVKSPMSLVDKVAYYVGVLKYTQPNFINLFEDFSIERAAELIHQEIESFRIEHNLTSTPNPTVTASR